MLLPWELQSAVLNRVTTLFSISKFESTVTMKHTGAASRKRASHIDAAAISLSGDDGREGEATSVLGNIGRSNNSTLASISIVDVQRNGARLTRFKRRCGMNTHSGEKKSSEDRLAVHVGKGL